VSKEIHHELPAIVKNQEDHEIDNYCRDQHDLDNVPHHGPDVL
jgi:hypothetical protein